jgi:hypothetical protein
MSPGGHLALPNSADYFYLAEGAANIVYKVGLAPEHSLHGAVQGDIDLPQHSNKSSVSIPLPISLESKWDMSINVAHSGVDALSEGRRKMCSVLTYIFR